MKVVTIVGTRPELIKLSRSISLLDQNFEHILIHTGQNYDYELNEIFFKELKIRKPDYFLNIKSSTPLKSIGNMIIKLDDILDKIKPDCGIIYGDTNSCLSAIALKKKKIPIFHLEAGNRSFDENVPEEVNRRIIDHISDINIVLTEHARRYLILEGIRPEFIIKTGSFMKEVLNWKIKEIKKSKILSNLKLKKNKFLLFSFHREENVDNHKKLKEIISTITALSKALKMKCIVSTHPRTRLQLSKIKISDINNVIFLKPMGFFDYNYLQMNSYCTLSDSGTITEESDILNFPAITIRTSHERPEGMDAGTLIMSGVNKENVFRSINYVCKNFKNFQRDRVQDYLTENASDKLIKIILSYTDLINKKIWCKE